MRVSPRPRPDKSPRFAGRRFNNIRDDGPRSFAYFEADPDDTEGEARLRNEAVAAVAQFLTAAYMS